MEIANAKERALQVNENDARIKAKLAASVSGNVHAAPRRDALADRDIFQEIQGSLKAGATVRLTGRMGCGVIRRKVPVHFQDRKKILAQDRKEKRTHQTSDTWIKTMWIPLWDHTGDMLKALAWGVVTMERGGRALTLRLGPEVIAAASDDPKGFVHHVRRRIAHQMTKVSTTHGIERPEFFFIIEDSDLTEVHLHGAILCPDDPRVLKSVRDGLRKAGGQWRGGGSARQLDMPKLETPLRWVNYIGKWRLGSALRLDGKTFAATQGLRAEAKHWYGQARTGHQLLKPGSSWSDFGTIAL